MFVRGGAQASALSRLSSRWLLGRLDKASAFQVDFKEEEPGMNAVAFNPRRQQVVTGGEDGVVRLWNTSKDGEAKEAATFEGHERPVADVCFHANGVLVRRLMPRSWCEGDCSVHPAVR